MAVAVGSVDAAGQEQPDIELPTTETAETTEPAFFRLDYSGDLWERPALTGDWGDRRNQLAQKGVSFQLDLEQTIQGNAHGGKDTSGAFRYSGSWDLRLNFDTGRMGLWPGGLIELQAESFFGQSINGKVGGLANDDVLYPAFGDRGVMLSQVAFTQFLSESFAVFVGKLDTTTGGENEFAWVHGGNFLNSALRWNPVVALTTPYSTLGAGFVFMGDWGVWSFVAYDTEGEANVSGFDTVFDRGTSLATEVRVNVEPFGKPGHQLFGFTWSDKGFVSLDQDFRGGLKFPGRPILNLLTFDLSLERESSSWSFFYNFDQYVYVESEDPTQGVGIFGRFGISDGEANPIETFYSVGIGGKGIIPDRDDDKFGLGYYFVDYGGELPRRLGIRSSQGVELFYNVEVTPWLHITPDLQVIINPGGFENRDVAVVYGVRAQMSF